MSYALSKLFIHLLYLFLYSVHFIQLLHDILDLLLLFIGLTGSCIPPCHILFRDLRTTRRFGSDFNRFTTAQGLDHLPELVTLLVKIVVIRLIVLDVFKLLLNLVDLGLVLVKEPRQVVDLLLLVLVLLLQSDDAGHKLILQGLQFFVELLPQFVLNLLQCVEQPGSSVTARGRFHLFDQVDLTLQVVQPLVVLLMRISYGIQVLVVLFVVVVDVVLQLKEDGHGHTGRLLLDFTIKLKYLSVSIYLLPEIFNPRFKVSFIGSAAGKSSEKTKLYLTFSNL